MTYEATGEYVVFKLIKKNSTESGILISENEDAVLRGEAITELFGEFEINLGDIIAIKDKPILIEGDIYAVHCENIICKIK